MTVRTGRTPAAPVTAGVLGVLVGLVASLTACGAGSGGSGGAVELTIAANAIAGGKNAEEADWIENWVIPRFEQAQRAEGTEVNVTFEPSGVDDEQYKTRLALDLQSGSGPDVLTLDGIWIGEFAEAGYIAPLNEVAPAAGDWDGWEQIPEAVQSLASYEGERYGVPAGTDGRVLYYNKRLFEQAGLPVDWQPASWDEVLSAAEALAGLDGVTPLQLNAGTAMGEATTMQGVLPLLAGTGEEIYTDGQWTGASPGLTETLRLYQDVYGGGLGDPLLQQEAQGRDKSFERFAEGTIGILAESDYFWRDVIAPQTGLTPMADRDEDVGYALIPAAAPGRGLNGQDFVSMSGGSARVLNQATSHPDLAWELLAFMHSEEALTAFAEERTVITPRTDVNERVLANDPMLSFVAEEVLPLTSYRPGVAAYPQVSVLLQEATAAVVSGDDPADAAAAYEEGLAEVVGADHVTG